MATTITPGLKLFLYDVLDVDPEAIQSSLSDVVLGSTVNFDRLMGCGAMMANLAFYEAWKSATNGSPPTRLDYGTFLKHLPGGNPSVGVCWSETTRVALMSALLEGTHIRVHSQHGNLIQSAGETYQRVLASLAGGSGNGHVGAKRVLYLKLSDRFGGEDVDPAGPTPLINVYASMVLSDPRLKDLEDWAFAGARHNQSHPKSIQEYYDRVNSAGNVLRLPHKSPLTNLVMDLGTAKIPPLSCVELLRIPLARDGHLWRRDSGGSLLMISKKHIVNQIGVFKKFQFRTSRDVPTNLLYTSLPLMVYSRIVIADDDFVSPPRGTGEIVRITSRIPDGIPDAVPNVVPNAIQSKLREIELSESPPQDSSAYWIPVSSVQNELRMETTLSMLSHHMQSPCPLRVATTPIGGASQGGDMLYHKFMSKYAYTRRLDKRVFDVTSVGKTGEVVLIDNRINVWSIWSMLVTLDNLRLQDERWAVSVFCSSSNVEFMRANLLPRVPNARIKVLDALNKSPFDIETYNGILKSSEFWSEIQSPRALIIQDDGVLVRSGLDDDKEMLSQDLVGAPWIDVPDNRAMLQSAGVGSDLVGNGGFSLRNTGAMREIIRSDGDTDHWHATYMGNNQPVPEDVFFAAALTRRGRLCPREVASRFAFEEKLPDKIAPLGFHKPWAYNNPVILSAYFDDIITKLSKWDQK